MRPCPAGSELEMRPVILASLIAFAGALQADRLAELGDDLRHIQDSHGLAAVAAIVVDRKGVILEHYSGVEDWRSGKAVSSATWFRAGSVTKVFTGLALLRAEELGLVRLDQTVADQLGGDDLEYAFANPYRATSPLVLADLSEHTAGWFDMSREEFDDKDPTPLTLESALRMRPSSRTSQWPPGRFYAYSNSGPGLAGLVVERASNQAFDQWIKAQVFEPLGMSATLLWSQQIEDQRATGYDHDYRTPIPYWHIVYRPSGDMNLRPVEMERFLRMMLNGGVLDGKQIFSEGQLRRLITPTRTLAARAGLRYGYGLGIYSSIRGGHLLYMHGGDADGYLTHFALSLESGLGYFVVINAFNHASLDAMKKTLDAYLIEGLPAVEPPTEVDIPGPMLERIEGRYTLVSTRFPATGWAQRRLEISRRNGGISVQQSERRWNLKATALAPGSVLLRRTGDPVATRAVILLDDHQTIYQDSRSSWLKQVD